jgi:hypothetical protein
MPSVNTLFGSKKNMKGKIVYEESLSHGLKLIITKKHRLNGNPYLIFEAGVCREIHDNGNVSYYHDAYEWCSIEEGRDANGLRYTVEDKPSEMEFTSKSGVLIKRVVEQQFPTEELKTWKYVWRCEIDPDKLLKLAIKTPA